MLRSGFLRDSTEYIQRHASNDVRGTIDNQKLLKQALLHSPNELVRKDTKEIQYYPRFLLMKEIYKWLIFMKRSWMS